MTCLASGQGGFVRISSCTRVRSASLTLTQWTLAKSGARHEARRGSSPPLDSPPTVTSVSCTRAAFRDQAIQLGCRQRAAGRE